MAGYVIAVFGLGLGIGLALGTGSRGGQRANGPARGTDRPETPEESLARLSVPIGRSQRLTGHLSGSGYQGTRPAAELTPPRRVRSANVPMKGGQRVMGPNQPRPRVQARIPDAPPR